MVKHARRLLAAMTAGALLCALSPSAYATQSRAAGTVAGTELRRTGVMYIASGVDETILDYYNGIGWDGKATLRVGLYNQKSFQFTETREIGSKVRNTIATKVKRTTAFGINYRAKEAVKVNPYWEGTLWH